ncbi:hypothetical protein CR513_26031, partial [Mucuna pruriens]
MTTENLVVASIASYIVGFESFSSIYESPMVEDIFHQQAIIIGLVDSSYVGGVFLVPIQFPLNYPFKPLK